MSIYVNPPVLHPFPTRRSSDLQHVVLRQVDGAEILRRVEQHGVTYMCAAPAVVAAALDGAKDWQGGEIPGRSEEHTSELQSHVNLVCRLLLEKKKKTRYIILVS